MIYYKDEEINVEFFIRGKGSFRDRGGQPQEL